MPSVSRLNDTIQGRTSGEHSGHNSGHSSSALTGIINGGCSDKVFIGNVPVALVGATTLEHDTCCGTSYGRVSSGSSKVFVGNIPILRVGDTVTPHNGTATVSGGSDRVFAG